MEKRIGCRAVRGRGGRGSLQARPFKKLYCQRGFVQRAKSSVTGTCPFKKLYSGQKNVLSRYFWDDQDDLA